MRPQTKFHLDSYRYYLQVEKGLAEKSLQAYFADLEDFILFVNKELEAIDNQDLVNYLVKLQSYGLSPASLMRKRSSIKGFYDFLQVQQELPISLTDFPKIKQGLRLPSVLSIEQVEKLLAVFAEDSTSLGVRNRAMLEIAYACGLRESELIDLKLNDLLFDQEVIRVIGKGNKQRFIPICDTAMAVMKSYIQNYRPLLVKTNIIDLVFVNKFGKKLSRMGVWKIIQKAADLAGFRKKISPHILRHSFATHLLEAGAGIRAIQMMLGHASINTTQIYTNIDKSHLISVHKKYHPRG